MKQWGQKLTYSMVIRVVEFSSGGTKLERVLPKNWCYQKVPITKNVLLNWYSSIKNKNKLRKIPMIFDIENWLFN